MLLIMAFLAIEHCIISRDVKYLIIVNVLYECPRVISWVGWQRGEQKILRQWIVEILCDEWRDGRGDGRTCDMARALLDTGRKKGMKRSGHFRRAEASFLAAERVGGGHAEQPCTNPQFIGPDFDALNSKPAQTKRDSTTYIADPWPIRRGRPA
jgi:hypothetical protein